MNYNFVVLEIVPSKTLLEIESHVDVIGMVKRGEIEDWTFIISPPWDNYDKVVEVVAIPILPLLETKGIWMIAKD